VVGSCSDLCFSSRRRHTRLVSDWSSDVCSSDLRCEFGQNDSQQRSYPDRTKQQADPPTPRGSINDRQRGSTFQATSVLSVRAGEIGRASCRERVERWVGGG